MAAAREGPPPGAPGALPAREPRAVASEAPGRAAPAGTVSGSFRTADPSLPLPEAAVLRPLRPLIPPPGPAAPLEPVSCPVGEDGAWSCALPPAVYDLSIGTSGVPGSVPHLRTGVEVRAGESRDLGPFLLEPGQSLSGQIAQEAGVVEPERCLLRVLRSPESRDKNPSYLLAEKDPRLLERRLSRDGSFTLAPLGAGLRALQVACPGFVLLHVDGVVLAPGKANRLRKPLFLRRPLEVAVVVRPALDPDGEPWSVHLERLSLGPSFRGRPVGRHEGLTDRAGHFAVPKLAPGLVRLQVRDGKGVRRALRDVRIDGAADSPVVVDLRVIHVEGRVTFRGAPVVAKLSFRDPVGGAPLPMRTDRSGRFAGELPRSGRWWVDVVLPQVRRTPIPVRVEIEPDEGGRAEVEIAIPEMRVKGRVLDPDGAPAAKATVALFGIDDVRKTASDGRGLFELRFVGAGPWVLAAWRGAGEEGEAAVSAEVEVVVAGRKDAGPFELRLGRLQRVEGVVQKAGEPVAGAEVQVRMGTAFPLRSAARQDGTFGFAVPEELLAAELLVRPPGGIFRTFEAPLRRGPVLLDLAAEGGTGDEFGTVTIDLAESWGEIQKGGRRLELYQDGHFVPFSSLSRWAESRGHLFSPAASVFTLPRLAPARYRVCVGPEGALERIDPAARRDGKVDCDEARLEPGEELRLRPSP